MYNIISLVKECGFPIAIAIAIATVLLVFTLKNYIRLQDKVLEKIALNSVILFLS